MSTRQCIRWVSRWLLPFCGVILAFGQGNAGKIRGKVFDKDQGVAGAPIEAKSVPSGIVYKAESSADGAYSIDGLPLGKYEVVVNITGFEKAEVDLQKDPSELDFHFQPDFQLGTLGDGDVYSRVALYHAPPAPGGPAPRTPDGKPDLSGVWRAPKTIESNEPQLLAEAQRIISERFENSALDSPAVRCMPDAILRLSPFFKILQTPSVLMVVIEAETPGYYQVFVDGHAHPKDPIPTWYGHSVGKWDGDTLVVDTIGFNDRRWLTQYGTPISPSLHITERFARPDLGHLTIETTVEDLGIYPKVWTMRRVADLAPDEEIMESICNENNKDPQHMVGK